MPLIGLIDPSHDEQKMSAPGRAPRWLTVEECLAEAYAEGPKWSPWSYELIKAVIDNHQERDYLSSSMVVGGCMRSTILERCADYIDDLDNRWAAIKGTLVHRTLELAARPGSLVEWRFWMDWGDEEFSCSPDIIVPATGLLADYKTTENPPQYYPYANQKAQVNINRYVVNHATRWEAPESFEDPLERGIPVHPEDIEFTQLALVYIAPKGPKTLLVEETVDKQTPNGKTIRRKVPVVWSDDEVEAYLQPRIEAIQLALEAYPDWPEGLEEYPGWAGGATWQCPGKPYCHFPNCLAKRYPDALTW